MMTYFLLGAATIAVGFAAGLWLGGYQRPKPQAPIVTGELREEEEIPEVVSFFIESPKSAAFRRLTQSRETKH